MNKGKLIVFEGIDKTGKTSISKMVASKLNAFWVRQPGDKLLSDVDPVFEHLRDYCKSDNDKISKLFAFLMDRSAQLNKIIIPLLNKGETVICDRWSYSTYAYQYFGEELNLIITYSTFEEMMILADRGVEPDLIFYFDKQFKRDTEADDYFDKKGEEYKERVLNGYEQVLRTKLQLNKVSNDGEMIDTVNDICKTINNYEKKVFYRPVSIVDHPPKMNLKDLKS